MLFLEASSAPLPGKNQVYQEIEHTVFSISFDLSKKFIVVKVHDRRSN
jgi:hypothetical protein